jgi:hypothetical protein
LNVEAAFAKLLKTLNVGQKTISILLHTHDMIGGDTAQSQILLYNFKASLCGVGLQRSCLYNYWQHVSFQTACSYHFVHTSVMTGSLPGQITNLQELGMSTAEKGIGKSNRKEVH